MRAIIVMIAFAVLACKGAEEGVEQARKQAELEQKEKEARGEPAKKIRPPVPGLAKIPCAQLIDPAAFTTTMNELEPLTVKDVSKGQPEAASCSLIRGGKRLTEAEQKKLLKEAGRLGVMAGDEVCNVTAFCYTIEEKERFRAKCKERKDMDDETMGTFACVQVVAQGIDDVHVFRFFDEDTKCILQVRGGPSNVDNDLIRKCAVAARDTIGPAQIAVNPGEPATAPAEPAGSAEPAADGSGS
jgi:hypothetical protein